MPAITEAQTLLNNNIGRHLNMTRRFYQNDLPFLIIDSSLLASVATSAIERL